MPHDMPPPDRPIHRDNLVLLAAYVAGLAAAAALLHPHFAFFEGNADSPGEAYVGFITACVMLAGVAPLVVLPFQYALAAVRHRRSGTTPSARIEQ